MPRPADQVSGSAVAGTCVGVHALANGRWSLPAGHGVVVDSYACPDRTAAGRPRRRARCVAGAARRFARRLVA